MGGRPPKRDHRSFDNLPPQIKAPNDLVKFGYDFQEALRTKVFKAVESLHHTTIDEMFEEIAE